MYRRNSQVNVFNSDDNLMNGSNGSDTLVGANANQDGELMDIKQEPLGNDQDMNSDSHGAEDSSGPNSAGGLTSQQQQQQQQQQQLLREQQQRKMMMSNPNGGIGPNGDPYEFSEDGKNGSKQVS